MEFIDPLPPFFYDREVTSVARDLIGCLLTHRSPEGLTAGVIIETEAYHQSERACHAFRGQTPRNAPLFGPPGRSYVYFTYGMHWCFNAVTGPEGEAAAVLIRAVEPLAGLELMRARRGREALRDLCRGPARLTQAFGISREQNELCLHSSRLRIHPRTPLHLPAGIEVSPRIGVRAAKDLLWRFTLIGSRFLSRPG